MLCSIYDVYVIRILLYTASIQASVVSNYNDYIPILMFFISS